MGLSERTQWPGGFGNWNRWARPGGTINLITPDVVLRGISTVRSGTPYNCAHELTPENYPGDLADLHGFHEPGFVHKMLSAHSYGKDRFAAGDRISVSVHSLENTHLDALSHVGHQGKGFDGIRVDEMVTMESAARRLAITDTPVVVTRAILVDIPRIRGIEFMTPGDWVRVEELQEQAGHALPGDAVLIRTGRWHAPVVRPDSPGASGDVHGDWAALHVDCVGWFGEKDLAIVGTDSTGDTFPQPTEHMTVHISTEVYLGMPLLHSMDLEAVAEQCAAERRTEFLLCVAPLKIPGGTGSPVAPICIL
jgi:kynurenine formamidase